MKIKLYTSNFRTKMLYKLHVLMSRFEFSSYLKSGVYSRKCGLSLLF